MSEPEDFLSRWSRLKRESGSRRKCKTELRAPSDAAVTTAANEDGVVGTETYATPTFDLTSLPSIHSITADTDIRIFLQTGVPAKYFDLFDGLGRGRLLPYASYYLTGSLYRRPLARLRETLQRLGIERTEHHSEPEDHAAILCDIMAGLAGGQIPAPAETEREIFEKHLAPWIGRFFADLQRAESADFYARVGAVGRAFVDIETVAFTLTASGQVL